MASTRPTWSSRPAPGFRVYYAENWGDPYEYDPQVYVKTTEVHEQWAEACSTLMRAKWILQQRVAELP